MENLNMDDEAAASIVAGLNDGVDGKRDREDSPDVAGGFKPSKLRRTGDYEMNNNAADEDAPMPLAQDVSNNGNAGRNDSSEETLNPYPFFFYKDYSQDPDPDPLAPLTPPGRVPNFPAKMHAILSRPDLQEIVCWMPHGRSWRILKPREFEIKVIPIYFEHAKFSSFVRQANGWGFRRITQGRDRNSYYSPLFLRGLPHLCKKMKRPGVAQKVATDPEHEPDLYLISEMHPVPEKYTDESVLLACTLQGGPKARMPIYTGLNDNGPFFSDFMIDKKTSGVASLSAPSTFELTPRDQEALSSFEKSIMAVETDVQKLDVSGTTATAAPSQPAAAPAATAPGPVAPFLPQFAFANVPMLPLNLPANSVAAGPNKMSTLAAANQLAFSTPNMFTNPGMAAAAASTPNMFTNPGMAAALQASSALQATQFAAGFAAATAMTQHQFRAMFESFSAGLNSSLQQQQSDMGKTSNTMMN